MAIVATVVSLLVSAFAGYETMRGAYAHAIADGRIKPGQLLLLEAMGGGFTWGASVVRM